MMVREVTIVKLILCLATCRHGTIDDDDLGETWALSLGHGDGGWGV